MMKKFFAVFLMVLLGAMIYVSLAQAEIKVTEGAAFRLRQEIWDDVVGLDVLRTGSFADRSFIRLRTQAWAKADFNPNLGVYLRLTNEMKYFDGSFTAYKANNVGHDADRYDPDEIVFDNLYFDAKNIFGLPVDVRIGRQDFLGPDTYGEGFLILDGTPGDGSRTFYFNAAKVRWNITTKNSVDFLYIDDPRTDVFLPSLHPAVSGGLFVDNKKVLTASREEAFVLYNRNKFGDNVTLEPYYFYKIEHGFAPSLDKLKLNTIGARAVVSFGGGWNVGGEYAHQWGDYHSGKDRSGNGGYIFVGRKYANVALKPEFDLRYIYLSGDDPDTAENETWDPLFSRNPYWNELIIYPLLNETAAVGGGGLPGYWTNMEIIKASLKLNFSPATNLLLSYQYLWAPEKPAVAGSSAAMFGTGTSRGHLPLAILSHKFSKSLDGMLQLEYFIPQSYYSDQADNATFFRGQLQFKL